MKQITIELKALINEVLNLELRVGELEEEVSREHELYLAAHRENMEGARLLGMGGEREADLMGKVSRLEKDRDGWKENAGMATYDASQKDQEIKSLLEEIEDIEKDRDEWKADADRLADEIVCGAKINHEYGTCDDHTEMTGIRCRGWKDHLSPAMMEALAAHEKLVGGSKKEG